MIPVQKRNNAIVFCLHFILFIFSIYYIVCKQNFCLMYNPLYLCLNIFIPKNSNIFMYIFYLNIFQPFFYISEKHLK